MSMSRLGLLFVLAACFFVFAGGALAGDITTGLLAWWKMDGPTDPNTNLVADSSGNGYDLIKGWDVKWENGGLAFYNDYSSGIQFPDEAGGASLTAAVMFSTVTNAMSVSFGINSGWTATNNGRQDIFAALSNASDTSGPRFQIEFPNSSGQGWIHAGAGGDKMIRWTMTDPTKDDYIPMFGQRAVITITKDSLAGEINPNTGVPTGEIKLYVNGQLAATEIWTTNDWVTWHNVTGDLSGMAYFRIGGRDWTWPKFGTTLDNFRIYNRALTAEDVALLAPPAQNHAGDANGDGKVDDLDASILAANWQRTGGATWAQADFNADGNVNDLDASILAANWQYGVGAAVPEPSLVALLVGGLAVAALRRRVAR